jgi:hypothetical protein
MFFLRFAIEYGVSVATRSYYIVSVRYDMTSEVFSIPDTKSEVSSISDIQSYVSVST